MDTTFYELLVPRFQRTTDRILLIASITIAIIATLLAFLISPIFTAVVLVLDFLFFHFIFPKFYVEYEYALLHQELDIDIIYKKAKRKSLLTLNLSDARIIAPANSHRLTGSNISKTLDYSSRDSQNQPYAIIISLNQSLTRILFQPNEKMISLLQRAFPHIFFMD